jgi:cobalt/nickel transport system permease protein
MAADITHIVAQGVSHPPMHIPDGYLSPVTSIVMVALVLPFWYLGTRKLRQAANEKSVPLVALLAAFSFVIMMFNVPLPGGTTGHAVGGALAAILLGPEVACVAISLALIIQAFLFGDGGILAVGANCFNMAVVLPYTSYAVYRAIASAVGASDRRRVVAAAVAGWVGLNVAAFCAAVEFGIQPALFHAADGAPLYAPYPLSVAIPAMVLPHMLVAGVIEGVAAALILAYVLRANRSIVRSVAGQPALAGGSGRTMRILWVGLAVLVVATPLGLLAPGTAWGEWGAEELTERGLSAVPQGLEKLQSLWGAPLPDYDLPALGNANLAYILSAVVGVLLVALLAWLFTLAVAPRKVSEAPAGRAR